jgi:zinc transport system permease protein
MENLLTALQYPFMQRALVIGILLGIVCSVLSIFVVLKKMAFIGHGIGHAAFGGVALSLFIGCDPFIGAVCFCVSVGLFISWLSHRKRVSEDSAIGLALTVTMAMGSILLAMRKSYTPDIFGYLFGDILLIAPSDVIWVIAICSLVLLCMVLLFRPLYNFAFHEELAWVEGIPIRLLHLVLVLLLSLIIVVAVKLVGVILISAFILIPGLTGFQLSSRIGRIFWLSFIFSTASIVIGLFLSYAWDLPSGATIVNLQFVLFMLAMLWQKMWLTKILPGTESNGG